jgi:hypothetical protein
LELELSDSSDMPRDMQSRTHGDVVDIGYTYELARHLFHDRKQIFMQLLSSPFIVSKVI